MPLRLGDGTVWGTLCAADPDPAELPPEAVEPLVVLARIVATDLDRGRAEERLLRAKTEAEAANRAKSAFLATMSHELRTPLTSILGYAGVLLEGLDGPLTAEQVEDVASIARGAERLVALVNDVLDLARIEAGALDLAIAAVELVRVVEQVRAELAPQADAKRLRLEIDLAPGLPRLAADPLRLHQILLNLAGNAVKFTEQGAVTIAARPAADGVEIAVRDTGIGIEPAMLPHVFDEFWQADASTTRRHGGAGLGLAITKRLVDLHGGTIRVASEPGRGATFVVVLPTADASG